MFKNARIKLTGQYLAIIMAISVFFSVIIYRGATFELTRIENAQRLRRPVVGAFAIDPEVIEESKNRIALTLLTVNLFILASSALSGYFLAGKTLYPIEQMLDDQKKFVSNASHELKTPLTSIKTEIEVGLRNKKLSLVNAKKLLKSNLEDVNKMNSLSNYLLKLNKYQEGKDGLAFKKVDLKNIVLKSITNTKTLANSKKLKIKNLAHSTYIEGNENSLVELVNILLDNAIKYSKNEGKLIVKTGKKSIIIQDFGKGIAKKDISHVFDRFWGDGHGLGLSIAKSIVKLHKGNIKVKSELGKGTTFKVNFS